ncbi:MAG: AAA family ATPase [Chlorobium sp.]
MKKLPIGIQTFSEIINEDYLYIDKTGLAYSLIENYKYVFLLRPRQFGKSLFLDTLKNIFEGNRELFRGLLIEDQWNWEVSYPVMKISFGGGINSSETFDNNLFSILKDNQERLGVTCEEEKDPDHCFAELIEKACQKYKRRVVVLIDDCDKPISDNIENIPEALIIQSRMHAFQSTIKDNDEYLYFVLLAGASNYAKPTCFGGLNNLEDISQTPDFAALCGYTQLDLETSFAPYLEGVDMEQVNRWYNGYNFFGEKVYNPCDILLFIKNNCQFNNYWFEAGRSEFLIKLLLENHYFIPWLDDLCVNSSSINNFDIKPLSLETMLFHSGYLTVKRLIRDEMETVYDLGFPNMEVQTSFNNGILQLMINPLDREPICLEMLAIMNTGNVERLEEVVKRLFASITWNNFTNNDIERFEGLYASVLFACFASIGLTIISEDVFNRGRINLTLQVGGRTILVEFKVTDGDPLEQIKRMKYYEKYSGERYLIGIVFEPKTRTVSKFEWEKL